MERNADMKTYNDEIDMMQLLSRIAPLNRTLASADTDKALAEISRYLPGSEIEGFACGTKAWSWTIPKRWELDSAFVRCNGEIIVDAGRNSLHVVNYSQPFKGTIGREELLSHLHTDPNRPDSIPFRFAFYHDEWGFCVPHSWLGRFTSNHYDVEINSRFESGVLNTLSYFLPGEAQETFIICANICHPLQVNDSLTGVAAAVDIMKRLAARTNRKYSYLLLVVPEMIGSIAFLANNPAIIERSIGGVFSEMLGTDGPLVGQHTRSGGSYWDGILDSVLHSSGLAYKTVPFLKSASNDEKVLDSPGVDIPTISLTRAPYPEYHSSDDNLSIISVDRLREGRDALQQIIDWAEVDFIPALNQPGPIFLSGHGLYPDWRSDPALLPFWESFIDVMYSIDNKRSFVELATARKIPLSHFHDWISAFKGKGLLTSKPHRLTRSRT